MDFSKITLLMIAGGRSSRMGQDKRWADLGGVGMLERVLSRAGNEGVAEIFLCVEERLPGLQCLARTYGARILVDQAQGMGPMEGLAQGLSAVETEWVFALSADMPFFLFSSVRPLLRRCTQEVRAVLPVAQGRRQPLAAFYHRSLKEMFEQALAEGKRSLLDVVEAVPHREEVLAVCPANFFNVNTPADLRLARGRVANLARRVPMISVVAPASGTGKTTFIESLLKKLKACGLRVGVVKSDAHGFQMDMEGKDSWRFGRAGAQSVAVVAPSGWMLVQHTGRRATLEQVAAKMEEIDLVLTESRTRGTLPALSLWRGRGEPLTGEDVAALFAKKDVGIDAREIVRYDPDDVEQAAKLCLFLMGR